MTVWLLCVVLDRNSDGPPVCRPEPGPAACHVALVEWLDRAWAWEARSHIRGSVFAACSSTDQVAL